MVPTLLSGLMIAAILGFGGLRVIQGSLTLGGLVAFQSLAMSFSEPFVNLVNYFGGLQTMKGALERLEDVYRYPLAPPTPTHVDAFPPKLAGRLELHNVSFGYSVLEPPPFGGSFAGDPCRFTGRARRCVGQRKVNPRQTDLRTVQTLVGRDSF